MKLTLSEATKLLMEKIPNRIPIGYWEQNGEFIFNTKAAPGFDDMAVPGQYVVASSGEVYGTNPMQHNLDMSKMKKFKTFFGKRMI